jgi:protein phosphatase
MTNPNDTQKLPALSLVPQMPQRYSSLVRVEFGAATHVGKVRPNNEDSYIIFKTSRLFERLDTSLPEDQIPSTFDEAGYVMAVADGMGGTDGGQFASALAIQAAVAAILHSPQWTQRFDMSREEAIDGTIERGMGYFKAAHEAILRLAEGGGPGVNRMGTTLTASYSNGRDMFILHVGDSRAYLFRQGELQRLTRDHTLAQDLVESGAIRPEEASGHRLSHVLTRALSAQTTEVKTEMDALRLEDHDLILLCSDGLSGMLDDNKIREILRQPESPPELAQSLIEAALYAGGRDNITVVLGRYHLPPEPNG